MRFWTYNESRELLLGRGFEFVERNRPTRFGKGKPLKDNPAVPVFHANETEHKRSIPVPNGFQSLLALSRNIADTLSEFDEVLMLVTEWGIWPSSENYHLYYRLRQSYGDQRLLFEAPGHFFLHHERVDLVSFIEVAILCGWGFHLIPFPDYVTAFVSHDEIVDYFSGNPELLPAANE